MKKIGIDARLYSQTGVGVYLKNLLFFLDKNYQGEDKFYIYLLKDDFKKVDFNHKNFIKKIADYHWHGFSEQTFFWKLLLNDNLDLMHFTYFSYPILYKRQFIATIHDLTPLYLVTGKASTKPKFIYEIKHKVFKIVLKNQVVHSSIIITPSLTIKDQIINQFGREYRDKIIPIYEGINYELIGAKENINLKKKFNQKFFIYVGNFYPHKNIERLIRAFSQIEHNNYQLILLGREDYFMSHLLQFNIKLAHKKKIVFFQPRTVSDLVYFYKNAQALVHPSLSEGFGLPLLEAAYFDCPVIASDIPVFKEILDNQYVSFNPQRVEDITKKIDYFINNKPKFDYRPIIKKFSFEKMALKTLNVYQQLLK